MPGYKKIKYNKTTGYQSTVGLMTKSITADGERDESLVDLWLFIIVCTTILALLVNTLAAFNSVHDPTNVLILSPVAANLFYIPLVIAAYWYPRYGIPFSIGISLFYSAVVGAAIYIEQMPNTIQLSLLLAAVGITCVVIIGVGAVVSSLAVHMRKNEVKYRGIFNHSESGIGLVNKPDHIVEVNRRFADILGYSSYEISTLPFPRIWADEGEEIRFFQMLTSNGNVENFETRFITKGGDTRWVLVSAGILPDNQFVCNTVDITARKKAEEELIIKDHAISSSLNAIAIMDLDYQINYVNHSLLSMMKFDNDYIFSHSDLWAFVSEPQNVDVIKDALKTKGSWLGEILLVRSDKTPFYALLWINLVRNDTGNPVCYMASCIDITDRKQMEEAKRKALEQIEKNIEQFAILGDHIRNPLAVIVGLSSLAPGDITDKIIHQAREIDRIVTQLDMGWIESEKVREFIKRYYMVGVSESGDKGAPDIGVAR